MDEEVPLQPIAISDAPDPDVILVADETIQQIHKSAFIFPVFIIAVSVLASFVLPRRDFVISQTTNLTLSHAMLNHEIEGSIQLLRPFSRCLSVYVQLASPQTEWLSVSGTLNASFYSNTVLLSELFSEISASRIEFAQGLTPDLLFIRARVLDFDESNFSLVLNLSDTPVSNVSVHWSTVSPLFSHFEAIIRVFFILTVVVALSNQDDGALTGQIVHDRSLTTILGYFTIIQIDPLYILSLFLSNRWLILSHLLSDSLYLGFAMLYSFALLGWICPSAPAIPESLFLVVLLVLRAGITFGDLEFTTIARGFQPNSNQTDYGSAVLASFFVVWFIRGMFAFCNSDQTRIRTYLLLLDMFWLFEIGFRVADLHNENACAVVPLGIRTAFFAVMDDLTHPSQSSGYTRFQNEQEVCE
jgi:hypothetical protein